MQQEGRRILVVGAGIGGIRSALDLAESGQRVLLIDRADYIGGVLSQLDRQFPTDRCGMCRLLPTLERDRGSQFCLRRGFFHDRIEILPATELMGLSGEPGQFTVRLRRKSPWVDPQACIGCGLCVNVCPVEISDTFNQGLGVLTAIHRPVPHAVTQPYRIDPSACTRCGACVTVCPTRAICLDQEGRGNFPILVVDDEAVVRDSLKEWMVNEGFRAVETAASGPEALAFLQDHPCRMMLADVKMPGMDGVTLLKHAREMHPELAVIMMTAYATVETAVEAMKIGAMDYFMKPFDPDEMMPLVERTYDRCRASLDLERTVAAVVLATGTDDFSPCSGINPYGVGHNPHVITHLQFERLVSGYGPTGGRLVRPADAKPISRIAWLQCVGSRDIQINADMCSTVCCMISIKEAMLAKVIGGGQMETAIYFIDLRTPFKGYQNYCDSARAAGVRFERARVHSLAFDPLTGDPIIRAMLQDGGVRQETVDLVVLAVGRRPAAGTRQMAETLGLALNEWGFFDSPSFDPTATSRPGIFLSGSAGGMKDIGQSVIQASAAALQAGRVIRSSVGLASGLGDTPVPDMAALVEEPPRVLVVVCSCMGRLDTTVSRQALTDDLMRDPSVAHVVFTEKCCDAAAGPAIQEIMATQRLNRNRLLVGACQLGQVAALCRTLARDGGWPVGFTKVVDLPYDRRHPVAAEPTTPARPRLTRKAVVSAVAMGLADLKHINPEPVVTGPVNPSALVVGGGIAGMTAALGIADMGYPVELIEQADHLGGNLRWLQRTLEGVEVAPFANDSVTAVTDHPLIHCRFNTRLVHTGGQVGALHTTIEIQTPSSKEAGDTVSEIDHGIIVLATGGGEATTDQFGHGRHGAVMTQKELEAALASQQVDARALGTVVMILCVGSRQPPRNYCSRVCCPTALKHALALKKDNPDLAVYVLYRDMMTIGFAEIYYTRAREAGVIFIQYSPEEGPRVQTDPDPITVTVRDPVLGMTLEIEADLLVLATGLTPAPVGDWQAELGIEPDRDGFFQEADAKWRPVESIRDGIFACGLALMPGTISYAVAGGRAAAQRALRVLRHTRLPASTITAAVRTSLCALCRRCIDTCPFAARRIDEEEQRIVVNAAMCQGCGACAAVCPNGAAFLDGQSKPQMLEMIDAAIGGGRGGD